MDKETTAIEKALLTSLVYIWNIKHNDTQKRRYDGICLHCLQNKKYDLFRGIATEGIGELIPLLVAKNSNQIGTANYYKSTYVVINNSEAYNILYSQLVKTTSLKEDVIRIVSEAIKSGLNDIKEDIPYKLSLAYNFARILNYGVKSIRRDKTAPLFDTEIVLPPEIVDRFAKSRMKYYFIFDGGLSEKDIDEKEEELSKIKEKVKKIFEDLSIFEQNGLPKGFIKYYYSDSRGNLSKSPEYLLHSEIAEGIIAKENIRTLLDKYLDILKGYTIEDENLAFKLLKEIDEKIKKYYRPVSLYELTQYAKEDDAKFWHVKNILKNYVDKGLLIEDGKKYIINISHIKDFQKEIERLEKIKRTEK